VHMVMIGGSYEEFPPTVVDNAIRDRRWMQGNLQHLRLLGASGLHWASRLHLLIGASAYLTSPAWLLLILTTIAQAAASADAPLVHMTPPSVLALTVLLLFGPKLMGAIWIVADRARRQAFGGGMGVLRSVAVDVPLSMLMAPVTMVSQTRALLNLLLGMESGWNTQEREARSIRVREVLPSLRPHLALGLGFAATVFIDPVTAAWLSPLTLGLLLSPWLISLTSRRMLGERAAAAGFFRVPEPDIGLAGIEPADASPTATGEAGAVSLVPGALPPRA
jgi:membrane glycosyltransferase